MKLLFKLLLFVVVAVTVINCGWFNICKKPKKVLTIEVIQFESSSSIGRQVLKRRCIFVVGAQTATRAISIRVSVPAIFEYVLVPVSEYVLGYRYKYVF